MHTRAPTHIHKHAHTHTHTYLNHTSWLPADTSGSVTDPSTDVIGCKRKKIPLIGQDICKVKQMHQ